ARFLLDAAREKGFKGLVTALGAAALTLTREYNPDAVSLDIHLPDIDGWRVLERLKKDPATRHVPVCVISTDDAKDRALGSGCLAFLAKPIASRDLLDGLLDHVGDYLNRPARRATGRGCGSGWPTPAPSARPTRRTCCWTWPRSSSTARWPSSRSRSGSGSSSWTRPTRSSPAARCSSSATTCGTSSRCPR